MAVKSMEGIAQQIKAMRFRKKFFGGVDENDVWRQYAELHREYQVAFAAQEEANQALLRERDRENARLKRQIVELKSTGNGNKARKDTETIQIPDMNTAGVVRRPRERTQNQKTDKRRKDICLEKRKKKVQG